MPPTPHRLRARTTGYTMLELLIVVVVGGLVVTAISTVITSQVRLTRNQLLAQQRRTDWSRFTYFLANEVGEGCQVRTSTVTASASDDPNCPPPTAASLSGSGCAVPSGSSLLLIIVVPIVQAVTPITSLNPVPRNIVYYSTGTGTSTTVFRCGPPILAPTLTQPEIGGRLNAAVTTFTPARLLAGIPITAAVDANNVSVTLTPSITGANIGPFSVRTRSIVIR